MVPILYSSNSTIVNGTSQLNTGFNPVLDDNGSAILQTLFYTNSGVTTYFTPLYWYPNINPIPYVKVDLFFETYTPSTTVHDCTIYLVMFDADAKSTGSVNVLASTIIYNGSVETDIEKNSYKGYPYIITLVIQQLKLT
jgi:hypothetical protein